MCWYCYWGWPKPVYEVYKKYLTRLNGDERVLEFGPSHIVWSDENFADHQVKWCMEECVKVEEYLELDFTLDQLILCFHSLKELLEIPEEIRCPPGSEFNNEESQCHPPPPGLEMVRKEDFDT